MPDNLQTGRWSKSELEIIKSNFQSELLYEIRGSMFQKGECSVGKDVHAILRKMFLPGIDQELPLGLQANIRNLLKKIEEYPVEGAMPHIKANDLIIQYLEQQLSVLEGKQEAEVIRLEDLSKPLDKSEEDRYITMLAALFLPTYIDGGLVALRDLAVAKEMTPEELKAKALKDSSK